MGFHFYKQLNAMDCGPTCLRMVAKFYGKSFNATQLREQAGYSKEGVSLLGISIAAENLGFRTRGVQITYHQLLTQALLPCIVHWNQNHFVVAITVSKNKVLVADPANGLLKFSKQEFLEHWGSAQREDGEIAGTALLLEPTALFYRQSSDQSRNLNWARVFQYLEGNGWRVTQVFIALLITSMLQLVFPFLTQSIVDNGINTQNLQYVTIILVAQLMLIFSRTIVEFIRSRLLLNISAVINLSILSDFWIKLTRLPISYYESHHTGDTMQRINDHKQIETFLTGTALNTLFSLLNLLVFSVVIYFYDARLFFVFLGGSTLYFLWVYLFLRIRRKINYQVFHLSAKENNSTLQMVQGMQEIKLNNAEQVKRWEWENIQASLYKISFKTLSYNQVQQAGATFINEGKNALITFLVAGLVIKGELTLGAMLAVQFILGQLNGPIEQLISFMQSAQDAKIGMERLNEVHSLQDEEDSARKFIDHLSGSRTIRLKDLSFSYPGQENGSVINNLSLDIPEGKITAIVGVSGSGKTTLLKILLKFFQSYQGDIRIGETNFGYISPSFWRKQCGVVLQDSFIFNDTIANNIAVGEEDIQQPNLIRACQTANILPFIDSLPNGFYTKLGVDGVGISQGQKQRLLIARAIYKNPQFLFFDEATNALDANNEKIIVENLQEVFTGKTVIVVAHRLSTVRNADKIVVLQRGEIIEEGTHSELSALKGKYYELVKNQLELGN